MYALLAEGSGAGIGVVVVVVVSAIAGAVFSYLFLRANPNKKAVVDREVDEISRDIAGRPSTDPGPVGYP